jgi:hypothetical protein
MLEQRGSDERWWLGLLVACVAVGMLVAASRMWLSDDCFISFRYARNLVEGLGLVFNPGERVEGFTNLSWTLWIALGLSLGISAEVWASIWSLMAFGGTILLLGGLERSLVARAAGWERAVPFAALAVAVCPIGWDWATGGLETSPFALLALAVFATLPRPGRRSLRRAAAAGLLAALAALTRPDGVLIAFSAGLTLLVLRHRVAHCTALTAAFFIAWAPVTLVRVSYYGSFFPNTYFAKSADQAYWSQGWIYVGSGLVVLGWLLLPALLALAAQRGRWRKEEAWTALSCLLFIGPYTTYVARVGGDFMWGRFLAPTLPFYGLLFAVGLRGLLAWAASRPGRGVAVALVAGVALACMHLVPHPWTQLHERDGAWYLPHGINNERLFYNSPLRGARMLQVSEELTELLGGLDLKVAFSGQRARAVYDARIPVAIEAETGLTDPVIARQQLAARGMVGHEKLADPRYLVDERRVHLYLGRMRNLGAFREVVMVWPLTYKNQSLALLRWDPAIVHELARRGARFGDFPAALDQRISELDSVGRPELEAELARLHRFYFRDNPDLARLRPYLARASEVGAALPAGLAEGALPD